MYLIIVEPGGPAYKGFVVLDAAFKGLNGSLGRSTVENEIALALNRFQAVMNAVIDQLPEVTDQTYVLADVVPAFWSNGTDPFNIRMLVGTRNQRAAHFTCRSHNDRFLRDPLCGYVMG
jgi:hypothetical protein